jgi:Flp pilus assembly protein TadD
MPDPTSPAKDPELERLGLVFLADILTRSRLHRPDNVEALAELATVLTRLGRFEEGLALDRQLVELVPNDATARYNLACSLALCHASAAALVELERAIELGYDDAQHMLDDADLANLRSEPRFVALIARLKGPS